ncbi:potassium channel family protein [Desulfosediminicola flagellatus]|uniref:potassium channel family protein n=1 Tax=Desulfosediminicola flagellatus TaxID=2569541 RepID=UPI0010AD1015|nr:NAD-binding protein [Desulfosediminicola flagellatus]
MKYLPSQLLYFFQNKTTKRNLVLLAKFVGFLIGVITLYSILFHALMLYEGRQYSWVTGFYWALTVMSTLGFGDITFHSDLGLLFTIFVLVTGVICMLIMLPFTFIQFFYEPWLEAQVKSRTPKELPEGTAGHIIITNLDPITEKLIEKLKRRNYQYVLVAADQQQGGELHDAGYKVVIGEPDDPGTFARLRIEDAAMVVSTSDDLMNTNIAFTVREISADVMVVTSADNHHSLDILNFPGNTHVFQFMKMLGHSLAERTIGLGRAATIISNFDSLLIAEISAKRTTLAGLMLMQTDLRQRSGATIIGLWHKGSFDPPQPNTLIKENTVLLLAGTKEQLEIFENVYVTAEADIDPDSPVLILGGGRVGIAAAEELDKHGIDYKIIEKRAVVASSSEKFILGDAADLNILKEAGIEKARAVIVTTHNDAMNIYLSFYCRQLRPDIQLICRSTSERNVQKLHMAGADLVLSYASMGANNIINLLKTDEISMFTEGLNIFSIQVPKSLTGKTLIDSKIRPMTGCSVVAIKSDGKLLVGPDPALPLKKGDELILIGTTDAEQKFVEIF